MRIEKEFAVRLADESLDYITFVYDFDTKKLYCEFLENTVNQINAIRICNECGINEWSYDLDPKEITKIMLHEHNIESNQAYRDMLDRRIGDHEI